MNTLDAEHLAQKGHPYDLVVGPDGHKRCRVCFSASRARMYAKKRDEQARLEQRVAELERVVAELADGAGLAFYPGGQ